MALSFGDSDFSLVVMACGESPLEAFRFVEIFFLTGVGLSVLMAFVGCSVV